MLYALINFFIISSVIHLHRRVNWIPDRVRDDQRYHCVSEPAMTKAGKSY